MCAQGPGPQHLVRPPHAGLVALQNVDALLRHPHIAEEASAEPLAAMAIPTPCVSGATDAFRHSASIPPVNQPPSNRFLALAIEAKSPLKPGAQTNDRHKSTTFKSRSIARTPNTLHRISRRAPPMAAPAVGPVSSPKHGIAPPFGLRPRAVFFSPKRQPVPPRNGVPAAVPSRRTIRPRLRQPWNSVHIRQHV